MDTKTLITNLNKAFCDLNKQQKKYSSIWLSDVDFGGLYHSGKYILNLKAESEFEIDSCGDEIEEILVFLDKNAKEELIDIWKVEIYDANDEIHCESDDIIIYEDQNACA